MILPVVSIDDHIIFAVGNFVGVVISVVLQSVFDWRPVLVDDMQIVNLVSVFNGDCILSDCQKNIRAACICSVDGARSDSDNIVFVEAVDNVVSVAFRVDENNICVVVIVNVIVARSRID